MGDETMDRSLELLAQLVFASEEHPGLTLGQLVILLLVAHQPGIRMARLAEITGESPANASRNARRLTAPDYPGSIGEPLGLLRLLRSPHDARGRHLVLSEAGRSFLTRLTSPQAVAGAIPELTEFAPAGVIGMAGVAPGASAGERVL